MPDFSGGHKPDIDGPGPDFDNGHKPALDPFFLGPSIGLGLSSSGSIYVPRETLNRDSPRVTAEIVEAPGAAGGPVPYLFGPCRAIGRRIKRYIGNSFYTALFLLGEGEIESCDTLFVDGNEIDLTGETAATNFTITIGQAVGEAIFWLGTSGQDVSSWADTATRIPGYPDTLAGYAVLGLRLPVTVVQRTPRVEVVLKGSNQVKDYTLGTPTAGYTDNWGNILIHWDEVVLGRTIDATSAANLADACAEDPGDGSKRRVGGIVIENPIEGERTREILRAHAAAHIIDAGTIYYVPDRPVTSYVMDVGPAQLVGETRVTGPSRSSKPSNVVIHWFDVATGTFQRAQANDTVDGTISERRMIGIGTAAQAAREAQEMYAHLTLEGEQIQFRMRNEGAKIMPGDVIRFTDPEVGIEDKPYRALQGAIASKGEWVWSAHEYQPAVYSNDVNNAPLIGDTNLSSPATPPTVTGLTVTANNRAVANAVDVRLLVSWDDAEWGWTRNYMLELYNTDVSPAELVSRQFAGSEETTATFNALVGGTNYRVDIKIQSEIGAFGAVANQTATSLPVGLISHWKFEDSDELGDELGNNDLDEVAKTSGPSSITGQTGDGRQGSISGDSYQIVGGSAGQVEAPFTLCGWFQMVTPNASATAQPRARAFFGQWLETGAGALSFKVGTDYDSGSGNELLVDYYDAGGTFNEWRTGKYVTEDAWTFIALVVTPTHFRLKFGTDDLITHEATLQPALSTEAELWFLDWSGIAVHAVDEVRLYGVALSEQAIDAVRLIDA